MLCLENNEILLEATAVEVLQPLQNSCTLNSESFKEICLFSKWEKFRQINEETKLMLIATKIVLDNAGINLSKIDKTKIGLLFGTTFGSFTNYENFEDSIITGSLRPQEFVCSLTSFVTSAVSVFYCIKGPCITFSGLNSFIDIILYAYQLLKTEVCEVVIIGEWLKFSKTLLQYLSGNGYSSEVFSTIIVENSEFLKKRQHNFYTEIKINKNFTIDDPYPNEKEIFICENSLGITFLAQKIKFAKQQGIKKFCISYITENKNKINFLCENKNL